MSKLEIASVLAFERKLDPSDALFFAGKWDERKEANKWLPITVREKSVRGTISNRLKTKGSDPAKLDAEIDKANLQRVDVAMLPNDCDTLKTRFTLRILGNVGVPSACNNAEYQKYLLKRVSDYITNHGFNELAKRYAYNIANGRFLWRNRVGAESIEIHVHHRSTEKKMQKWQFNAQNLSLRHFESDKDSPTDIDALSQIIKSGLEGNNYVLLDIEAYVRIGEGQEVFPSQELILDKGSSKKGQKSKTLYQVDNIAAMHSQKIGNALRTIDTWYPCEDSDEDTGPISVEPYGSVTSRGKAYRQPKEKADFYTLFDDWVVKDKAPQEIGNQHFVIANLVRGGVFGKSGKE